ncbi:hypothetical protein PhaeoP30_00472 [Phaeobacter inhibens]|uniref:hypothetical protein n=1 Tax=Phaeobacter inhibens TaxID=221822 RepID=UPI000C9BACFA|nr:hypothetical protein [Phaeobacter inhibens]AUQ57415.1 hypothetical protein PhaeoP30_00472 [Phaeobacter inhibens]
MFNHSFNFIAAITAALMTITPDTVSAQPATETDAFPDAATEQAAASIGIRRYAAYQRLSDIDTIRAYCQFNQTVVTLEQAKFDAIDAGGDEAQITANVTRQQEDLLAAFNRQNGLIDQEYVALSVAGYWPTYCSAFERGWGVFGVHSVGRVERSSARAAEDVIETIFINELQRPSAAAFFNPSQRSAVECQRERYDDKWYVGCRLISMAGASGWRVFLIAESGDERLFFNPINGPSIGLMSEVWPSIPATLRSQINIANYAGARLPISDVLAEFD